MIPYFGYARQDRRPRSARVAISAKVVADMLANVGVNRVLTVDLHADQIQGFFDIPVDNIYGSPTLVDDIEDQRFENLLIVSPDIGGVVRARAVAKSLGVDLAIIDKRRPKANVSEVMHIIGDVEGRTCVLVDDMVDTAGTLCLAAKALKDHGAERVYAYCTHPCCPAAPSRTSKAPRSTKWWSPTPSRCPRRRRRARAFASWTSPRWSPKRYAASATKNRSAQCFAADGPAASYRAEHKRPA